MSNSTGGSKLDGPEHRTDIYIGNNAGPDCLAVESYFENLYETMP